MKTVIDYILAVLKILGYIAAYALVSWLLGLIHPLAPGLVLLVAVVGFVAHMIVDMKRMNEASAKSTAEFEAKMAETRARLDMDLDDEDEDETDPDAEFRAWRDAKTQAWFREAAAEADRRLRAEFEATRGGIQLHPYREDDPVQRQ